MPDYTVDPMLGCWIWHGATNSRGYPVVKIRGRTTYARRWIYERERGAIAPGYELRSTCRVKRCCNPAHLEPMEGSARRRLPRPRRATP